MDIYFKYKKYEKACNSEKESIKKWGAENAKVIRRRLAQLQAADNLSQISHLPPPRCHQLVGRENEFAVYAKHPFRLIFEPFLDSMPRSADGGINLKRVTAIRIIKVEDYHGK